MVDTAAHLQSPTSGGVTSSAAASQPRWTGRTRGGYFGNWFFVQLIRVLGLRGAYVWLVFVAAYFTFANPRSFRASVNYLQRVLGKQPWWRRPLLVYRHFFSFGVTLLDRLTVVMGRQQIWPSPPSTPLTESSPGEGGGLEGGEGHKTMSCSFEGEDRFHEFLNQGKGIILLGAHVGGWEMAGHLLGRFGIPVNLVVLEKEQENIRRLYNRALEGKQFRILTTDENPLRSIPIMAALRRGEMVAMHGDRAFGGADLTVPFLGGQARFPIGAYHLAAVTGAPIFQVFAVRERLGQYRFFTFPPQFVTREAVRRKPAALRECVEQYARRLESVLAQYPYQWYNIYNFWEENVSAESKN
jgi:predicted LPLAT superfamily acyltransferase